MEILLGSTQSHFALSSRIPMCCWLSSAQSFELISISFAPNSHSTQRGVGREVALTQLGNSKLRTFSQDQRQAGDGDFVTDVLRTCLPHSPSSHHTRVYAQQDVNVQGRKLYIWNRWVGHPDDMR